MIKTVTGVKNKLSAARDVGFKYCKVSVDGNNIGCALIDDILDSITYCNTAGGRIRTFIHRGYEYPVAEGIEINALTNEDFLAHYFGVSERREEKNPSLLRELARHQSDALGLKGIGTMKPKKKDDDNIVGYQPPKEETKKEGILTRFKNWLKGDVRYKK